MTPLRLIGLTGYAGTGKDTVRSILEQDHGFYGMAFADPLRAMLGALLQAAGLDEIWMTERDLKEEPVDCLDVSYRHMAQTLGTEWGRNLQPDFWLRIAGAHIVNKRRQGERLFVISDVRFVNEAEWVREAGGQVWRIHRPQALPVRPHPSESEIDHIEPDLVLDNSNGVDALWAAVDNALNGAHA